MTSPATRRPGGRAATQRVVEESEQRHAEHVDGPPAQPRVEQVEVGAIVQQCQRRQRDQRAGNQDGAGREGERSRPR